MRRHRISEEGGGVTGVEEEEGVEICWCAEIHQRHLCNPLVCRDPPTSSVFPIIIRVCHLRLAHPAAFAPTQQLGD